MVEKAKIEEAIKQDTDMNLRSKHEPKKQTFIINTDYLALKSNYL